MRDTTAYTRTIGDLASVPTDNSWRVSSESLPFFAIIIGKWYLMHNLLLGTPTLSSINAVKTFSHNTVYSI
jgi:hypothetical protein